jgi:hypothetical protein
VAAHVPLKVVVFADNANFSGLDDNGVDDGAEPGLPSFDRPIGETLHERPAECLHDVRIESGLLAQSSLGALKCGRREVPLLP